MPIQKKLCDFSLKTNWEIAWCGSSREILYIYSTTHFVVSLSANISFYNTPTPRLKITIYHIKLKTFDSSLIFRWPNSLLWRSRNKNLQKFTKCVERKQWYHQQKQRTSEHKNHYRFGGGEELHYNRFAEI